MVAPAGPEAATEAAPEADPAWPLGTGLTHDLTTPLAVRLCHERTSGSKQMHAMEARMGEQQASLVDHVCWQPGLSQAIPGPLYAPWSSP